MVLYYVLSYGYKNEESTFGGLRIHWRESECVSIKKYDFFVSFEHCQKQKKIIFLFIYEPIWLMNMSEKVCETLLIRW